MRFFGYFKQTVYESPNEFYRVRPITVLYYLEDDSMQIYEDNVENSGMPQVYFKKNQTNEAFSNYGLTI